MLYNQQFLSNNTFFQTESQSLLTDSNQEVTHLLKLLKILIQI